MRGEKIKAPWHCTLILDNLSMQVEFDQHIYKEADEGRGKGESVGVGYQMNKLRLMQGRIGNNRRVTLSSENTISGGFF